MLYLLVTLINKKVACVAPVYQKLALVGMILCLAYVAAHAFRMLAGVVCWSSFALDVLNQ